MRYERFGDKKNSNTFEMNLERIYEARDASGLSSNIGLIDYLLIQVQAEDRDAYLAELSLMTGYTYAGAFTHQAHLYTLMEYGEGHPAIVVRSVMNGEGDELVETINKFSDRGKKKPHARYLGEVYNCDNVKEVRSALESQGVKFFEMDFPWTVAKISQYTWNFYAYQEKAEKHGFLRAGFVPHKDSDALMDMLKKAKELQAPFAKYLEPVDHMATRVLAQDREHALLELIKMTSYYYWGSYMIADQNSSTNVTRNSKGAHEYKSPAKVFTASETPHYLDYIEKTPSPTEEFVLQYGRRMHHVAHGIKDNEAGQAKDSVDIVVDGLKEHGVEFLLQVIGSEEEGIKQIFSKASKYSFLITEYVQRFNDYQGFFTKENVAFLTKAAGADLKD